MSTTSLRMRVLPRYPARITGTDGIKVERESYGAPDLIIRSAYDELADITTVPDPATNYFLMWDAENNLYRRIPFQSMFDSAGVAQGYPTINAAENANIPVVVHALELYGDNAVGDGLGGLYIDTNNGASETFISGDGRTWYLAADIRIERLTPATIASFATAAQGVKADGAAQKASNLSDLASIGTAQDNIQVGAAFADVATAQSATIAARNKRIRTQFYATANRTGGANYKRISFASLTGYPALSYFRSTDRFMPDGTTDATNGGYWLLDELVTVPQQLGALADGTTDDAAAIVATQAYGKPFFLEGTYLSNSRLVFNGQTVIMGNGRDKSKIIWGAAASGFGIQVVPATWEDYISITDIGLWTRGTTGTAIDISWLALSGLTIPYFDPRCNIFRNDIRGETVATQGFIRGIRLDFQFGARVEGNMIQGIYTGGDLVSADFDSLFAIEVPDQSTRTLANLHIRKNVILGFRTAASINNVEGVWFEDNDLQVCFDGLFIDNPFSRVNQYRISGNHIGVSNTQISVKRARKAFVQGNEVSYRFGRTGAPAISLIIIDSVDGGNVLGNTIRGNVATDTDVVLTGLTMLDTTGILSTRQFTVDDNQFENLSVGIAPASTSSSNTYSPGNNFVGIRVANMSNGGTNSIIQPAYMGSGLYQVPAGQNPALMLSGKGAASLFVNRDGDGAVQGFSRINTVVGTITVSAGATAYNTSSDEQWKTFRGNYDPAEAIKLIKADPVRVFDWDEEHGGTRAVGWGAQTSYALSHDLASRGYYFNPRTHEECNAGDKWFVNPFTNDECSPDDTWITDEHGSPISEMVDGAIIVKPDVIEAAYQPWGIDQGKRSPYLWAATGYLVDKVEMLIDEIENLKKKISEMEASRTKRK